MTAIKRPKVKAKIKGANAFTIFKGILEAIIIATKPKPAHIS